MARTRAFSGENTAVAERTVLDMQAVASPASSAGQANDGSDTRAVDAGAPVDDISRLGSTADLDGTEHGEPLSLVSFFASGATGEGASDSNAGGPEVEGPSVHCDERFVVTRNGAPVTSGPVLHNDGAVKVALVGVEDAGGIFYSLLDIDALVLWNGKGLELEFGWVRIESAQLVFEAKPGTTAYGFDRISYVAEDGDGNRYSQTVQVVFTDDANAFGSDEDIDAYYSRDGGEMGNLNLAGAFRRFQRYG